MVDWQVKGGVVMMEDVGECAAGGIKQTRTVRTEAQCGERDYSQRAWVTQLVPQTLRGETITRLVALSRGVAIARQRVRVHSPLLCFLEIRHFLQF